MASKGSRFMRYAVILWLLAWAYPTQAAVVAHYEECSRQGETWSFPAIEAAGHTPKLLMDLTRADLQGVDVLFVTNCSLIIHFDEFVSRVPDIHAAINDGLIFVLHDRNVDLAATVLPGPGSQMEFIWNPTTDTQVQDDSTLVTHGPAGTITNTTLDGGWASSHGYVDANKFPAGVKSILSQTESNRSVLFHYPFGQGHVVYSTMPLDHFLRFTPYCQMYVDPMKSLCLQSAYIYTPNVIAFSAQLAQRAPEARVSSDITIDEGQTVTLDGSASFDPQNRSLSYVWTQVSPALPNNLLSGSTAAKPTFNAPFISENMVFTYQLVVTNSGGLDSEPVYVNVTVKNNNQPPVADAGNDVSIKAGVQVTLNGERSYDPDSDPITSYEWIQVEGPLVKLDDSHAAKPSFTAPAAVGQSLVFELSVHDGKESSAVSTVQVTVLDNTPPIADAGDDMVKDEATIVVLNGNNSYDSDGDGIEYQWQQIQGLPVELDRSLSPTPTFTAPTVAAGGVDLIFELTVLDNDKLNAKSASDQVVIHVRNSNDPPRCDLAQPSKEILWPPNHKMVQVNINGIIDEDSQYNQVVLNITSITQDEPVDGKGDGHTSPDSVIQESTPSSIALLRAERNAKGNGRVYKVNFEASDGLESCVGSVTVGVPKSRKDHDKKHLKYKGHKYDKDSRKKGKNHKRYEYRHNHKEQWLPVDDGQFYDATEVKENHSKNHKSHDDKVELNNELKSWLYKLMNRKHDHEKKESKNSHHKEKKSVSEKYRR